MIIIIILKVYVWKNIEIFPSISSCVYFNICHKWQNEISGILEEENTTN
jgi:uncharacterized protein Usg